MVDDLNAPLGQDPKRRRRFALPKAVARTIAGLLAAVVVGFGLWTFFVENPLGGEPVAVVSARVVPPPKAAGAADGPARALDNGSDAPTVTGTVPGKSSGAATHTVNIIDGTSGRSEQVVIPAGASERPNSGLPEARKNLPAAPTAAKAIAPDPRLTELSRHGPIPKVAVDGARAADAYARPAERTSGPRVAIVVGKLGSAGTGEALAKLPAAVSLAFAPYGGDLERSVARARGEGREVLLQVPMEPQDHPDNDPGPPTLLTSLTAEQNVDRLHWSMSRFQGYAGIAPQMGARFAGNEPAVAAVVREISKRGLIYFDDGAASGSVASQVASANNVPFAKADLVIDAAPTAAEIDRALARLEALARERGMAVGAASALPVSIERIARWAKAAAGRGVTLVPVSAAAKRRTTEVRDQ